MSYPTASLTVYAEKQNFGGLLKSSGTSYANAQAIGAAVRGLAGTAALNGGAALRVGQRYYETGGGPLIPHWELERLFLAFRTGNLNLANAIIDSAAVHVAAKADESDTEFNLSGYSHGSTPWGPGISAGDWAKCDQVEGVLASTGIISLDTYYSLTVAAASINTSGRTELRLHSSREGTDPKLNGDDPYNEYVDIWSPTGEYPPKLVLALRIPKREAIMLDMLTTLEGIDGTGDYNTDLSGTDTRQVWRGFLPWDQIPKYPSASLVEGDCEFAVMGTSPVAYSVISAQGVDGWPIDVIAHVAVDQDQQSTGAVETELKAIESDIIIAVLTDPLRGNSSFVRDTYHAGSTGPANFGNGKGAIRITFGVKYDFEPDNP